MRNKLKDMKVNLAQDFAEYRQTCDLFSSTVKSVVGAFHNLRRGRGLQEFVRILKAPRSHKEKAIADSWLAYQFGVKPLLEDIHHLVTDSLSEIDPDDYREKRTRVTETEYQEWTDAVDILALNPPLHTTVKETQHWRFSTTAVYRIVPGDLHWLASYGITNPAELAWELIPYSFVVDWLFNVGDVLSGLDALVGVELHGVQSGRKGLITCTCMGVHYEETNVIRDAMRLSLSFGRVRYEPSKSLRSVLSGLALLTQIRSKR
jgi:hypothetical protein